MNITPEDADAIIDAVETRGNVGGYRRGGYTGKISGDAIPVILSGGYVVTDRPMPESTRLMLEAINRGVALPPPNQSR